MMIIVFLGLGNMGVLMLVNLVGVGYVVCGFDLVFMVVFGVVVYGVVVFCSVFEVVVEVDVVIIMLFIGEVVWCCYIDVLVVVCLVMLFIDSFMILVIDVCEVYVLVELYGMF